MTLKFSDLKPGDKINYRYGNDNEWYPDIGIYVKSEGDKHWFKWNYMGFESLFLTDDGTIEIRYAKESEQSSEYYDLQTYSDEELIQELRNRGFSGTIKREIISSYTVTV